jgi:glycyl-tRNA synthetase
MSGKLLTKRGVSSRVDNGNQSIGKRYARTDELGIPFAITIDKDSLTDQAVTLREIESMKQLRLPIKELGATVTDLIA